MLCCNTGLLYITESEPPYEANPHCISRGQTASMLHTAYCTKLMALVCGSTSLDMSPRSLRLGDSLRRDRSTLSNVAIYFIGMHRSYRLGQQALHSTLLENRRCTDALNFCCKVPWSVQAESLHGNLGRSFLVRCLSSSPLLCCSSYCG